MTEERRSGDFSPTGEEEVDDAFGWDSQDWGTAEENLTLSSSAANIDEFPTSPLLPIDQWPTQPIPALLTEPYSFQPESFIDNEALSSLDSLLQPAIERIAETGPHPAAQPTGGTGSYIALGRNLVKSSGIYALGSLASPLASLVLSPFLAHHLSPTNYGILAVLTTVIGLTAGITQLGLGSAFFRVYNYEFTESAERRSVLATVTLLLALITVPVAVVASLLAPFLAGLLQISSGHGNFIILTAWIVVIQNLTVPGLAWMRAENRPLFFILLTSSNLLLVLCVNLLLVGVFDLGVAGSLLATGSGYACMALCTLPLILWRTRLRVRKDIAWSLITFGAPQVLSYISYWVLQVSDRYLLSLFGTLAQVASYSVAYSLGSVLSTLVISPFSLAWPAMMFSVAKRKDAPRIFQMTFRYFSMLLLFVAFAVSIASTVLLDWLFPKSYHSAGPIIPVVAESIVFYGIYIVFMTGSNIRRKMSIPAACSGLAAFVNFALNLVLIPHFGPAGAAASTLIAYILLALVGYWANQRIYPIPYEMIRFGIAFLIGIPLYIGADFISLRLDTLGRWSLTIVCLVIYGASLFFLAGGVSLLKARNAGWITRMFSDRRVS